MKCSLRHPRRCKFYSEYYYCKFGSYCKFSHERIEDKGIKLIKKELDEIKKHLDKKEMEIKKLDDEIKKAEIRKLEDMKIIVMKNEIIEKELKEVRKENEKIKEDIISLRNDINSLKNKTDDNKEVMNDSHNEDIEEECPTADSEKVRNLDLNCDKCEFVAKSEGGLKTHKTVKHKTVSLGAFTKITR